MSNLVSDKLYVTNKQPYVDPMSLIHPIKNSDFNERVKDAVYNEVEQLFQEPSFSEIEEIVSKQKEQERKLRQFVLKRNPLFKEKTLEELTYSHFKGLYDDKRKDEEVMMKYFGLNPEEMQQVRETQRQEELDKLAKEPLKQTDVRNMREWVRGLPFQTNGKSYNELKREEEKRRNVIIQFPEMKDISKGMAVFDDAIATVTGARTGAGTGAGTGTVDDEFVDASTITEEEEARLIEEAKARERALAAEEKAEVPESETKEAEPSDSEIAARYNYRGTFKTAVFKNFRTAIKFFQANYSDVKYDKPRYIFTRKTGEQDVYRTNAADSSPLKKNYDYIKAAKANIYPGNEQILTILQKIIKK
jgi:hypothetical protein